MTLARAMLTAVALTGATACAASGVAPEKPSKGESDVKPYLKFSCVQGAQGARDLARVAGARGHTVAIRPTGEACDFDLMYRVPGGTSVRLGRGGYLVAAARQFPDGTAIVCASNVAHTPDTEASAAPGRLPRVIEQVDVECGSFDGQRWSPMAPIASGGREWAGWVASVDGDPSIGAYSVRYTRDFSFQVMNTAQAGRPASDGVYESYLQLTRGQGVRLLQTVQRFETVDPAGSLEVRRWRPSPQELAQHGAIDPSRGACPPPYGCPR